VLTNFRRDGCRINEEKQCYENALHSMHPYSLSGSLPLSRSNTFISLF